MVAVRAAGRDQERVANWHDDIEGMRWSVREEKGRVQRGRGNGDAGGRGDGSQEKIQRQRGRRLVPASQLREFVVFVRLERDIVRAAADVNIIG
jgi:hypothetical protein